MFSLVTVAQQQAAPVVVIVAVMSPSDNACMGRHMPGRDEEFQLS